MTAPELGPIRDVLDAGGHICLVVDDDHAYDDLAAGFLASGLARGEKTVAFGPLDSPLQEKLGPLAAIVADPYVAFLQRGSLRPADMFAMFREQTGIARREGFSRLRVAADMDWLLPSGAGSEEAIGFEVLLDRVVSELDATVLCAYRRSSFDPETVRGMGCVHPVVAGDEPPPFRLVAGADGAWELSGEIDVACAALLGTALRATAAAPWVLDLSGLNFADVVGLRTLAMAAVDAELPLEARGASPVVRRTWEIAGFDQLAPGVRLVD